MRQHPFLGPRHPTLWRLIPAGAVVLILAGGVARLEADQSKKKKQPPAEQFLVFGTVFEERGFALPGVEIQVRRLGEKKVRWRRSSDVRGEFAVRVPPGGEYELTVKAKGYVEQTRKIEAKTGSREDLVFRLQPAPERKKK